MIQWVKVWHGQKNGMRTIRYSAEDSRFEIESRRRRIPHANGEGYWYHTSYYVVDTGTGYERECWRLKDAKKTAEELIRGMGLADPEDGSETERPHPSPAATPSPEGKAERKETL